MNILKKEIENYKKTSSNKNDIKIEDLFNIKNISNRVFIY